MFDPLKVRATACWIGATAILVMFAPIGWFYCDRIGRTLLVNHNEGWNAVFIDRAMSGGVLYPGPDEMLLNNYPPLSFYIVGTVGRLVGDTIAAGRLVSYAAFLLVSLLIGAIVLGRTRSGAAGVFAASFFLLLFASFPGDRIAMNDPQLLGHALMMSGLAALWLAPARAGAILLAAGLMVTAGLVKHNLIAVPLAATAWMAWRGRQPLLTWLGAAALAGAAGLGMLLAIWGTIALQSILSPRHVSLSWTLTYTRKLVALADIPLGCWALVTLGRERTADTWFAAFFVIASMLEMVLFAGGDAVDANVAYDLLISLALALGLAAGSLSRAYETAGLIGMQLFYFSLVVPLGPLRAILNHESFRSAQEAAVKQDIAYMKQHPGPALCLDMALCWYAGIPVPFDQFYMGEQFGLRLRPAAQLAARFRAKEFAIVQISAHMDTKVNPLPPPAMAALQANYVASRQTDDRIFFLPHP